MPKIVYHGTFSEGAPHEWLQETFHAGTMRSTEDRAADQMMGGEVEPPSIRRVHAYEISDSAPMSRREWSDPDVVVKGDYAPNVPQHKENRIYPYKNLREDRGSTSYVIPTGFVGNKVKHLGVQFQGLYTENNEDYDKFMGALSTMVGGKFKE
jgi:hypothetical protein